MIHRVWDACEGPWRRIALTTLKRQDDELCDYLHTHDMEYRRGSEEDVLSRYASLANYAKPHCLVRVCGDAPFIKREWIKAAVDADEAVFVPQLLHAGSFLIWEMANRAASPKDWEHAGYYWFEKHAKKLELVPDGYMTVNTSEDMEEARRRSAGQS